MRKVDPTIILGGPAACSPTPPAPLIEFAKLTRDELDFLSFHAYASGNPEDGDQLIYDKGLKIAESAGQVAELLKQAIPDKEIEVHLNEWNISFSWKTPEPRMRNHKGAVYDALSLIAFAQTPGLTAANAWNDTEYTYGKSDGKGGPRGLASDFGKKGGAKYRSGAGGRNFRAGGSANTKKSSQSNPFSAFGKKSKRSIASNVEKELLPKKSRLFEVISNRYTQVNNAGGLLKVQE